MNHFYIRANNYLQSDTPAFYHVPYTGMGNFGNPNYLNDLKNTYNNFSITKLRAAVQALRAALEDDLPKIIRELRLEPIVVCVVPRAKAESNYRPNQKLFQTTVQATIQPIGGLVDGTSYLRRHTNTKTTHLRKPIPNYNNDGAEPYPGITAQTCHISPHLKGKDILLIDDIYTPGVNVDEDAINALLNADARSVAFYSVGKV